MCRVTSTPAEPNTTPRPAKTTEVPEYPFTVQSLKAAIPAHCWERNVVKSIGYAVRDFVFVGALYAIAGWLHNHEVLGHGVFWWLWYLPWVFAQGTVFWALFVVGHDCGHGSFSDHPRLNDLIGHITHTFILTPYHPWRITHRRHHMNTGNLDRDAAFVALSESEYRSLSARIRAFRYELFWLFGFFLYLLVGMPGSWGTHFSTDSAAFERCPSEFKNIRTSLAWWWGWLCLLHIPLYLAPKAFVLYYFMPWATFITWISVVTHLHHTDAEVPWYRGKDWTYLRGALSTVDRSYGALIDHIHHDIGTHVIHHLFIHVPHYNLREATAALKPVLGPHYRRIQTNPIKSLWENCLKCRFVPDEGGMVYYTK